MVSIPPVKTSFQETSPTIYDTVSWSLMGLALLTVLVVHLVPALLVGLAGYQLVQLLVHVLKIVQIRRKRAKLTAIGLVSLLVVGVIALVAIAVFSFLRTDSLPMLLSKLADSLDSWRGSLPPKVGEQLPATGDDLRQMVMAWLPLHLGELKHAGAGVARIVAQITFALAIGILASLREYTPPERERPLAKGLIRRVERLDEAFRRIVFAQFRIATINSFFTAVYLVVVLPLMHVHLPLVKTMVVFTFLVGLLPVVGNLVSNTIIVLLSLSVSAAAAVASLCFLVAIHKLEYFLNAHLIGNQIHAHAWELLLAMLVMEAAFGLPGLVAAPIYYAYLKDELTAQELV